MFGTQLMVGALDPRVVFLLERRSESLARAVYTRPAGVANDVVEYDTGHINATAEGDGVVGYFLRSRAMPDLKGGGPFESHAPTVSGISHGLQCRLLRSKPGRALMADSVLRICFNHRRGSFRRALVNPSHLMRHVMREVHRVLNVERKHRKADDTSTIIIEALDLPSNPRGHFMRNAGRYAYISACDVFVILDSSVLSIYFAAPLNVPMIVYEFANTPAFISWAEQWTKPILKHTVDLHFLPALWLDIATGFMMTNPIPPKASTVNVEANPVAAAPWNPIALEESLTNISATVVSMLGAAMERRSERMSFVAKGACKCPPSV
jgi:hypothetical protein